MIKSEKRLKVTDMVGKKQRDIREDNKSVVIDCLLRSQMTLAELEQQLKLSQIGRASCRERVSSPV